MATNDELVFNNDLCARVKQWREEKNWTAAQMATALGIPPDRSHAGLPHGTVLPHYRHDARQLAARHTQKPHRSSPPGYRQARLTIRVGQILQSK
jgi:transcriptional regulator with XRE-family HTH domain